MAKGFYISRIKHLLDLESERRGRTVTPKELADHIGASYKTIYNWMDKQGTSTLPSAEHMVGLCDFFNLPWTAIWSFHIAADDYDISENITPFSNKTARAIAR